MSDDGWEDFLKGVDKLKDPPKKYVEQKKITPIYVDIYQVIEEDHEHYLKKHSLHQLKTQEVTSHYFKGKDFLRRIDLHGCTIKEADFCLYSFFKRCQIDNIRFVVIITGKGQSRFSEEKGALQGWAAEWFHAHSEFVVAFSMATPQEGGSGAYFVQVRKY